MESSRLLKVETEVVPHEHSINASIVEEVVVPVVVSNKSHIVLKIESCVGPLYPWKVVGGEVVYEKGQNALFG